MAAKLVIGVAAIVIIFGLVLLFAFRYFTKRAEQQHEKEMMREEHRHEEMDSITTDPIDRELEREKD